MEEILDIFNDKLEIIGQDTRKMSIEKVCFIKLYIVGLLRIQKTGDLYICNKGRSLKISPLLFDITVGHIDSGENIENAMIRD